MIRVLFVSTSTTLGGAEKTVYTLATLLDPKRFTVAGVVSLKPSGPYAHRLATLGVPVTSFELSGRPTLKTARALAEVIAREKPDLVCAFMYQAIQLCRWVKRRGGLDFKLISSPRVNYRTRTLLTLLVDRLLKGADDLLIAESRASRDFLLGRLGYAPAKVKVVYNGVDVPREPPSQLDRLKKRQELELTDGELLVGAIGRLDAQKGHETLVSALGRLKDRPIRCVILGDGPERGRLQARIKRLGLEKSVRLLGERADAAAWLAAFDVFALPSRWEGLPNALLEAMAVGLPVVASAVDGVREVVTDGRNGLLAPAQDPAVLAAQIGSLCGDPEKRRELGAAARKTVVERFGLMRMLSDYEAAYLETLSPAARPA